MGIENRRNKKKDRNSTGKKEKKIKLRKQLKNELEKRFSIGMGESRHAEKIRMEETHDSRSSSYIHSIQTLKTYKDCVDRFADWCRDQKIETMKEAKENVGEFVKAMAEKEYSPYSIATNTAALCKIFNMKMNEVTDKSGNLVERPKRTRMGITRSRLATERDRHVSKTHNAELIQFCKATGVRRHEIDASADYVKAMRGTYTDENGEKHQTVHIEKGKWYVHIVGKGGKSREAEIIGDEKTIQAVVTRIREAGENLVWPTVHTKLDIHSLRAEYAANLYRKYARPAQSLSQGEKYCCRADLKGKVLDRQAMLKVSQMLGHNRISVFADHYAHLL